MNACESRLYGGYGVAVAHELVELLVRVQLPIVTPKKCVTTYERGGLYYVEVQHAIETYSQFPEKSVDHNPSCGTDNGVVW